MTDLTQTELTIRAIVAQHLPGVGPDQASAYATKIHPREPFHLIGLVDGRFHAAVEAVEAAFRITLQDSDREACKCVGDLAALIDNHAKTETAA